MALSASRSAWTRSVIIRTTLPVQDAVSPAPSVAGDGDLVDTHFQSTESLQEPSVAGAVFPVHLPVEAVIETPALS